MSRKEFTTFKDAFLKYQKLFGLTGYKIYFYHEPLDKSFANITVNQEEYVATVRLDTSSHEERDVAVSAKHEALHLLLYKLEDRALSRFVGQYDIYETVEELVGKLEKLIQEGK